MAPVRNAVVYRDRARKKYIPSYGGKTLEWPERGPEKCIPEKNSGSKNLDRKRSAMGKERPQNHLTLMDLQSDVLRRLDFKDIIADFAAQKTRRKCFEGKPLHFL